MGPNNITGTSANYSYLKHCFYDFSMNIHIVVTNTGLMRLDNGPILNIYVLWLRYNVVLSLESSQNRKRLCCHKWRTYLLLKKALWINCYNHKNNHVFLFQFISIYANNVPNTYTTLNTTYKSCLLCSH